MMRHKLNKIMTIVDKVKSDCNDLKRKGLLTERGQGQLDAVELIENALKD